MSIITGTIAASIIIGLTIAGAVAAESTGEGAGGATSADPGSVARSTDTFVPSRVEFKAAVAPNDDGAGDTGDSAKDKKKKKPKTTKPVDKTTPML
mgnify:CR=1 FL=1|jgi:hypothetical protein